MNKTDIKLNRSKVLNAMYGSKNGLESLLWLPVRRI